MATHIIIVLAAILSLLMFQMVTLYEFLRLVAFAAIIISAFSGMIHLAFGVSDWDESPMKCFKRGIISFLICGICVCFTLMYLSGG